MARTMTKTTKLDRLPGTMTMTVRQTKGMRMRMALSLFLIRLAMKVLPMNSRVLMETDPPVPGIR